ncbi:fibronectin type III domain-containing protein [Pyrenochaeta sp. MPI-SDFR-AT-0127]|nr:fibronectin type III domain-containing protein [Pyrenochaeta sp. MPI-SDFR-AT-0127]
MLSLIRWLGIVFCFCSLVQTSLASTIAVRQNGLKFLIVGDSISHGAEGDYTWRYRLWQWLRANNIGFEFVGPWRGTFTPAEPIAPQPPLLQGQSQPQTPDQVNGGYALDVDAGFDKDHFCHSGRQVAQVKNTIAAQVAAYQPDYVLIELGFNDLGWFINGPDGLLSDMKQLINNARNAKGNIKFAIANVPQRTRINGRQDLIDMTIDYNSKLATAIPGWSTTNSPIKLVKFSENYACGPDNCPAAFDGLHPNKLGEYQIAQAFSRVLNKEYGIGSNALDVPANLPAPSCNTPVNVRAVTAPYGVAVTWDKVYGARGYNIRSKRSSFGDWTETWYALSSNRYNQIWVLEGETWEFQVRTSCGDKTKSSYSGVVSAAVKQSVAPGPKNIVINPTGDGFNARWDPPDGGFNVQLYEVFTYDVDEPCAWLLSRGIKGNSITVNGLKPGHRHVLAISTWTDLGPGFPSVPPRVKPGAGAPGAPSNLKVNTKDGTTVILNFDGSANAANYRAWTRNINNASDFSKADLSVVGQPCLGIAFLFPGVWNYEFCVTAMNGMYTFR